MVEDGAKLPAGENVAWCIAFWRNNLVGISPYEGTFCVTQPNAPAEDHDFPLGAKVARLLLESHGVPKHKHSPTIREVLGLSYSQAHRKASGASPWTLEELAALGRHFGESLESLVLGGVSGAERRRAHFVMGQTKLDCFVWPGALIPSPEEGSLVALGTSPEWTVTWATPGMSEQAYQIRRLLIEPPTVGSCRLAVLDDMHSVADTIATSFDEVGIKATAYYTVESLFREFRAQAYDAYIIDWVVGKETSKDLIVAIRTQFPAAAIAVLTGQMTSDMSHWSEVAGLLSSHRVLFFEKPAKFPIMNAAIIAELAKR